MALNKTIIAMVVAHDSFAGMDREKFAEFAEKRKVYWQRFPNYPDTPDTPIAFFVLSKGDETLPLLKFADLANVEPLVIATSSDALNINMLSTLWLIDIMRRGIYKKPGFQIHVVREMDKDTTPGESKYANRGFDGLKELLSTIDSFPLPKNRKEFLEYVQGKCSSVLKPGGAVRLSNALIERALSIVYPVKKGGYTLTEIKKHIPEVKPLCPPGDPNSVVVADIEKDIQSGINSIGQEESTLAQEEPKPEPRSESKEKPEATPQEALIMCMQVILETYNWKPDEIKLKLTPTGYTIMP
ncbi:hypothetical protein ES707_14482 [subsurface metagenome]